MDISKFLKLARRNRMDVTISISDDLGMDFSVYHCTGGIQSAEEHRIAILSRLFSGNSALTPKFDGVAGG